ALDFRSYAAAVSQARWMAWISPGVGWSVRYGLNLAAMRTRRSLAVMSDVGGVVAGGGVPAGGDGLACELERDGAPDRVPGAVAGLPGTEFLFCVFYCDLDAPSRGVSFDDLRGACVQVGGDQGQVVPGCGLVADQHDLHGPG